MFESNHKLTLALARFSGSLGYRVTTGVICGTHFGDCGNCGEGVGTHSEDCGDTVGTGVTTVDLCDWGLTLNIGGLLLDATMILISGQIDCIADR